MNIDGPTYALQAGLPDLPELQQELDDMRDILMDREPMPIDSGLMSLMEVATVFHARAKEMEQLIHRKENEGVVLKQSSLYKFRTGELRSFIEMSKTMIEVGSRRVTNAKLELDLMRETV